MKRGTLWGIGFLAALALAFQVDDRAGDTSRRTMSRIDPAAVALTPAPIEPDWVLEGKPITLAAEIAHTDDGTTRVYVWQTTKSRFHWFYDSDEIVQILDGEVIVADGDGPERRLGPGDVAFFPVGSGTTPRVTDHLRKIVTLKRLLPGPIASLMRWGRAAKSWLIPKAAFAAT